MNAPENIEEARNNLMRAVLDFYKGPIETVIERHRELEAAFDTYDSEIMARAYQDAQAWFVRSRLHLTPGRTPSFLNPGHVCECASWRGEPCDCEGKS
jgi:hypothetical protein